MKGLINPVMQKEKKSVVLLSAGLDSTVNLYAANADGGVALALSFDYGQRAAPGELRSAAELCRGLGLRHEILHLPYFQNLGQSSLTDTNRVVPVGQCVQIDDLAVSQQTAKAVWVPNRNGVFLNIAAAFAESLGAGQIVPGFNIEEAATFPDNSGEYLQAVTEALKFSTATQVRAHCYTTHLNKTEIVQLGQKLQVPLQQIWPCYYAGPKWCGQCESCQRAHRAFANVGVPWPA